MDRSYERPRKPASHLIHLIASAKSHHPNFLLFLGAGASVESGVKSATEMISDWRETYSQIHADENGAPRSVQTESWYQQPNEYSVLFEALFDQPSQRREHIETCLEEASPSWGYMYLVNLIHLGVFNTVFTTNFDDLLNEACYLYSSDVRPIVCAHDSSIRSIRISTKRPKIIKLHGDFLYDNIKNTVRELESLENNMREKFKQYCTEFGMIVLGYSGRDRSIMDPLDAIMRSDDSFPHGVYWCVRKGATVPKEVDHLCRFPRFHLVEIPGFNAFLSELHSAVSDDPHPIIDNPYGVLTEKLRRLLISLGSPMGDASFQKTLARDVSLIGQRLGEHPGHENVDMPHEMLAWNDWVQGNLAPARQHITEALRHGGGRSMIELALKILSKEWNDELGDKLVKCITRDRALVRMYAGYLTDVSLDMMKWEQYDHAEAILKVVRAVAPPSAQAMEHDVLNVAQLWKHRNTPLSRALFGRVQKIAESSPYALSRFGALCVLGESKKAAKQLRTHTKSAVCDGYRLSQILDWPITKLLDQKDLAELKTWAEREQAVRADTARFGEPPVPE